MVNRASLADFNRMTELSIEYALNHPAEREWVGSPFQWLRNVPSATQGAMGRHLVEDWAIGMGLAAGHVTENNQHYVLINGTRIQVKLSTLWRSNIYRFQQIRDQQYDYLLCIGLSPQDVHAWLIPKTEALDHLRGVSGQHTGADATETYWITAIPGRNGNWLDEYGDQLSDVKSVIVGL